MKQQGYLHLADVWCEQCIPDGAMGSEDCEGIEGESDAPDNCCKCRQLLNSDMTAAGVQYILDQMVEMLQEGAAVRNRVGSFPPVFPWHRTSTVLSLMAEIVAENSPARLPILADALEDGGYDYEPMLTFLRNGTPGGVADLHELQEAILGEGRQVDEYHFRRQVDIVRDWADDLKHHGLSYEQEWFRGQFMRCTAPGVDARHLEVLYAAVAPTPSVRNGALTGLVEQELGIVR